MHLSSAAPAVIALAVAGPFIANAQSIGKSVHRVSGTDKPVCSHGAICFSGEVYRGERFSKPLNSELEFVLEPGWTIAVVPKLQEGDCQEFASVVNAPYRVHRDLYIDVSYGWTAEDEVSSSPREFRFVTNCADYRTEYARLSIVLWPYTAATPQDYDEALAKLGTSPLGNGRFWITESKVSHAGDTSENKAGSIEWMKFTVEILLPQQR